MHTYTWNKLAQNTQILRKGIPNIVNRFEIEMILPYVGTKTVLVKIKAWGETTHNIHNVTLLFNDCEILTGEQKVSLYDYFKIDYQGQTYYIKKFNKLRNPLPHRCTCQDYFFTWAWSASKYGNCLYGPPPRAYKRKTKNRPPRNPRGLIGFCKHLFHVWEFLRRKGLAAS